MKTLYTLSCRDGMRVDIIGFYLEESNAQAEADRRNEGNWYSTYYVSEVHALDF